MTGPGIALGHADVGLSNTGLEQALRLSLRWRWPWPEQAYCSDLRRARQTIAPLLSSRPLPVHYDARLREMHFGEWDGRSFADLEKLDPHRLARWYAHWQTEAVPGGESFADVRRRVRAWLRGIAHHPGPLLVCAHAGSLRALKTELACCSAEEAFAAPVPYASPTLLRVDRGACA